MLDVIVVVIGVSYTYDVKETVCDQSHSYIIILQLANTNYSFNSGL